MEREMIEAEVRTERGKHQARRLRRTGKVPAILYGAGQEAVSLSLHPKQFEGRLRAQGQTTIFDLRISGGESTPVMVADPQYEPVRGTLLHVDLHRIAMDRKLHVAVPVAMQGEPRGVKQQGGVLELLLREVEAECFPADIPARLPVDVTGLAVGESIRISDLQILAGDRVRLLREPTTIVCHVVAPKLVEEKPAVEVAAEAPAEPEVIKKGKAVAEEEAPAEGREKREKKE